MLPRTLFRVTNRVPLYTTLAVVQGVFTTAVSVALVVVWGFGALGSVLGNLLASAVFFSSLSTT
jgi:hypothetical protein